MPTRSTLALLILVGLAFYSNAILPAQETPTEKRFEKASSSMQITSLPSMDFKTSWQSNRIDFATMMRTFYSQHPDVVTDPLKQFAPLADRTFKIPSVAGRGAEFYGPQGNISIYLRQVSLIAGADGENVLRIPLEFRPIPMIRYNGNAKEIEKSLFKISRQIAQKTAELLPDFSREYIKKNLTERESKLDKQFQEADAAAADLQHQIANDTGLPSDKAAEQLAEISRQQIAAELSLVGMQAREKAISIEIAKCKERIEQNDVRDDTVANLQHLLQLRTERLDKQRQLHQSGVVTEQEVQTAEADVLAAKIDLDKTRAALKRAGGGEQLDAFTGELSRLAIERAETQARRDWLLKMSQEISKNLSERREAERRLESLKPKLTEAEIQRNNLQIDLREIRKSLENVQPLRLTLVEDSSSGDDGAQAESPSKAGDSK